MKIAALFTLLVIALNPSQPRAEPLIPFQARLTDAAGDPVADGVYSITFRIYTTPLGGTAEITEFHESVSAIGGYVNVLLGAIESLDDLNFAEPHYLGITVGQGQEMVPRHQLVPAFHSRTAELATVAERATNADMADRARAVQRGGVTRDALDDDIRRGLVPSGTVLFFDGATCPSGWAPLEQARGRVVVGLQRNGMLKGVRGTPFGNLENRSHTHALGSGATTGSTSEDTHNHEWVYWNNGANSWMTWDPEGKDRNRTIVNWGDGFDEDGSGLAAIANRTDESTTAYHTQADTHSHEAGSLKLADTDTSPVDLLIPTIQLLVCRKS